jgi:hypothetical protein
MRKENRRCEPAASRWAPRTDSTTLLACCTVADAEGLLDAITQDAMHDLDLAALVMRAAQHVADVKRRAA